MKATQDLNVLETVLEQFKNDFGRYPTTEEGLLVLVEPTSELKATGHYPSQPYVQRLPEDPWGTPYQYVQPAKRSAAGYDLWSFGADGKPGGTDLDADFGNWPGSIDAYRATVRSKERSGSLLFGVSAGLFAGFVLGIPLYLFGLFTSMRRGRSFKGATTGFHLGALIYLIVICGGLAAVVSLL